MKKIKIVKDTDCVIVEHRVNQFIELRGSEFIDDVKFSAVQGRAGQPIYAAMIFYRIDLPE